MAYKYIDAAKILCEAVNGSMGDVNRTALLLEDVQSPVVSKYVEKLYDAVITKGHVDFDDIPMSRGDITKYKGYAIMTETLNTIKSLATAQGAKDVLNYVNTILTAIERMKVLSPLYQKGFSVRSEYVAIEYNTFVYTIVQATSSLLYEFVDYVKRPDADKIEVKLKNNYNRANLFYVQQLEKYNNITSRGDYKAYLEQIMNKGRENFIGTSTMIGIGVVAAIGLSIIPITRALIYRVYNSRARLSDYLAQQAYFLEMNKTAVEANGSFEENRKKKILMKQQQVHDKLIKLSDKLKVNSVMANDNAVNRLKNDNRTLTLGNIQNEVNNAGLELI